MSAPPESLPPRPRRFTRRRALVYSALGLLALVIIAVLLAFLFLRSERFQRFIIAGVENALEEYGLRAEIGRVEPGRGLRSVRLRDVRLFNLQTDQPIATIDRATFSITIRDPFALRLRRKIALDRLELDRAELWVVFDERGQSNLQGLRRPPPRERRITFDFEHLAGSLNNGALYFSDRRLNLQSDLRDLAGKARPIEGSDPSQTAVRLAAGGGRLRRNGHDVAIETAEFIGRVMATGAEIERLTLRSSNAEIALSGRLDNWQEPRYHFDTQARVETGEALPLLAPELPIEGAASFDGRIEGKGDEWQASGRASADELRAARATFSGARAETARIDLQDGRWTFSIQQARVNSVVARDTQFTNLVVTNLNGTFADGRGRITATQAAVERIETAEGAFNGVVARNLSAIFGADAAGRPRPGQWVISTAQAQARSGAVGGAEFTNASAANLNGSVINGRIRITTNQAMVARVAIAQTVLNGVTLVGVTATFEPSGRWAFSSARTMARSGVVEGVEFTNASASNLSGIIVGGRATITSNQATAERAFIDGIEIINTTAANLNVAIVNGRAGITSGQITIERVQAARGAFDAITLRGVNATLGRGVSEARGEISLQGGVWNRATLGQIAGQFAISREEIALTGFSAEAFGGVASGDLVVRLAPGGISTLRVGFTGLQTAELFSLAGARDDQLVGMVAGNADLSWAGTDLQSISGTLTARFDGQTTTAPDAVPIRGAITARAQNGLLFFDQFMLQTESSKLAATGSLVIGSDSDLRFSLISTRAEELQAILDSMGLIRGEIGDLARTYELRLLGAFSIAGAITGPLDDPTIAGDFRALRFELRNEFLGSLSGGFLISPAEWRLDKVVLTTGDNSWVTINYAAPRDATRTQGRLDITINRVNIDRFLGVVGSPTGQRILAGEVSGEARLTGLPAAPMGEINLSLINGVIAGQPAASATALARFDGQTARVERIEARLPQGRFVASGEINLQNREYQFQGQADQLSLERLAEAFNLGAARVSGVADTTFQVSGDFDDPDNFNVELTAQGRRVTVNDREIGPVTLTARTTPAGRIDIALTTQIAGLTQPITASVEWRQPGRPAEIRADLVNFDLAPFLTLYAPNIAQTVTGQVTAALRIAGPLVDAQGEFSLAGLRGALSLTDISLEVGGTAVNISTPLNMTLADSQLIIPLARITALETDFIVRGAIALTETAPINVSIEGRVNLSVLNTPDLGFDLGGAVAINLRIGGTLGDPRLTGTGQLTGVSVTAPNAPITLDEGSGRVTLAGDQLTLENFTARAGDGVIRINGNVTLAQFRPSQWRFDIVANDAEVLWQDIRATADANLTLTGAPQSQTLSGAITIPQAEYTADISLADLFERGIGGLGLIGGTRFAVSPRGALLPINLDLRLQAVDSLVINNNLVNTVASASGAITGSLTAPDIRGRITFEGGAITFRGRRYDITVGSLDLLGDEILVRLLAEGDIRGYRVYIGLDGPISNLNVTLRSEPDLSRAEIISLVVAGRVDATAQISEDLALSGLTAAAALLSEEFISRPIEREALRILGINRFQIEPVLRPYTNPAARLTIGREIARGLTFIYSTNLSTNQDQTGLVEYDFTRNFSILASYTQSGNIQIQSPDENIFTIEVRGRRYFSLGVPAPPPPTTGVFAPNPSRRAMPAADVRLNIHAAGPDRVEISESRLRNLAPIIEEGYSRARMRIGERNLTNYLQEQGYFFAEVNTRCIPADCAPPANRELIVFYDVRPGARYRLRDIRVTGVEGLSERELTANLQSRERSRLSGIPLFGNLPFVGGEARGVTSSDRLRADRETIRGRLVNLGYRSARVGTRLALDPRNNDLVVIFDVLKGPRSIIDAIVIRGNTLYETPLLAALASIRPGVFFLGEQARQGALRIREFYTSRGFLEARTEISLEDLPGARVRLIYDVTEGARAFVRQIVVRGLTITREESIRRFFDFKQGEVLTPRPLRDTVRDLYATGAFREVIIRAEQIPGAMPEDRIVSVDVAEMRPLLMYYGVGYSTDSGPRATLQLTNTNLFGRVITGSTRLLVSQTDQLAQLSLTNLRPWGKKWPTIASALYNRDSNLRPFTRRRVIDPDLEPRAGRTFGINRFVAFVQTERKLSERMALRFRYSFENAKLFNLENIPEIEVTRNERAIRLGMLSAGFTRDTRDNALWPLRGQLFSGDYSLAARQLGGNESFNKFFGAYQRYETPQWLGGVTFAMAARVGLAKLLAGADRDGDSVISEPERRLPISERFFAGGATTLRGFRFEQAGPQAILEPRDPNELPTLVPIGGDALVIFNFELHIPLTRRLRLVPFYDVGNVFRRVSDISLSGLTSSIGLGVRFNTPLGPVGVDYGFLIDPPSFVTATGATLRQPRGALHFRIGQTF